MQTHNYKATVSSERHKDEDADVERDEAEELDVATDEARNSVAVGGGGGVRHASWLGVVQHQRQAYDCRNGVPHVQASAVQSDASCVRLRGLGREGDGEQHEEENDGRWTARRRVLRQKYFRCLQRSLEPCRRPFNQQDFVPLGTVFVHSVAVTNDTSRLFRDYSLTVDMRCLCMQSPRQ